MERKESRHGAEVEPAEKIATLALDYARLRRVTSHYIQRAQVMLTWRAKIKADEDESGQNGKLVKYPPVCTL